MDDAKSTRGWTERELLSSLLYLVQKNNVTFDWSDGVYPEGRNANGFRQKINALKRALKPEWDTLESGVPVIPGTPKMISATPRKRKAGAGQEGDAKKPRARSSKKTLTPSSEEDDEDMGSDSAVKSEPKEEQLDGGDGEMDASWEA